MKRLSTQHTAFVEAGTDEAGRGCLAGPVTAAAVILPKDFSHPLLNDSKKLTQKQRYNLRLIIEQEAIAFAVAHCSVKEIEEINILNASIKAMHRAIEGLSMQPEFIAVDGNRFHQYETIPHECIIKGDGRYLNIAAASILAVTPPIGNTSPLTDKDPVMAKSCLIGISSRAEITAVAMVIDAESPSTP